MAHDHGQACLCQADHRPSPLELVEHHIDPMGEGGPDTPENRVFICPTTHYNVHELFRLFKRNAQVVDFYDVTALYVQPVNRYAYRVAADGFRRMTARRAGYLP